MSERDTHSPPGPSAAQRQPWHRLPGESTLAYQRFCAYRDGGPTRTVAGVAEQSGKHPSYLYRLSRRFDWDGRVLAWDLAQQQQQEADLRRLRQEVARRQLEEVQRLRGLPLAGLAKWAHRDPVTGEWTLDPKVKPRDMVSLLSLLWETETKAAAAGSAAAEGDSTDTELPSLRASLSRPEMEQLLAVARERGKQE